jgi:hypothetical protein
MEIKGKFVKLLPEESGLSKSGKEWKKQSFVIEHESGQYPKQACFEVWGDTTDLVQGLKPGEEIMVWFNIESREYNGKYYTGLKASTLQRTVVAQPVKGEPMTAPQQFEADKNQGGGPALPF